MLAWCAVSPVCNSTTVSWRAACAALSLLAACAKGVQGRDPNAPDVPAPPAGPANVGQPGAAPAAPGQAAAGQGATGQIPMGTGMTPAAGAAAAMPMAMAPEPCMMGAVEPCVCEATGTMGQRTCRHDMASPTMGYFSMCEDCAPPDPAGMGAAGMTAVPACMPGTCPIPASGQACCTADGRCGASVAMGPCT